jgi:hypothetical protein
MLFVTLTLLTAVSMFRIVAVVGSSLLAGDRVRELQSLRASGPSDELHGSRPIRAFERPTDETQRDQLASYSTSTAKPP